MPSKGRNIIVVGTSAGGSEALDELTSQLPTNIPASIFIVQHLPPEGSARHLLKRLARYKAFRSKLAVDGERFEHGRIYVAPPDHHLLVKKTQLLVTKGARENRHRPAIDPLFRSAAVTHGPHVIGVVLTGHLDDGTAGLTAIGKCGGVTVVQDPREAAYPGMPQSALSNLRVDHCVRLADMALLLDQLAREPIGDTRPIPGDVKTEAIIAERVVSDVAAVNSLGDLVPYNCPNCGGVLWNVKSADTQRFRCHTGHSFTSPALLASQTEKIEETLWICLRMFEERKNLLSTIARTVSTKGTSMAARAREAQVHIERIRAILLAPGMAEGTARHHAQGPSRSATRATRAPGGPRKRR
jgi:two-component system, chemotaxis family, protein-glutamate methylesterase/glutaminase